MNGDGTTPLPNRKMEAFARALAAGRSPTDAAREAGYSGRWVSRLARRMLEKPEVQGRVAVLARAVDAAFAAETAKTKRASLDELLAGIRANIDRAVKKGDLSAVNAALKLLGQSCGAFSSTKRIVTAEDAFADLTAEQISSQLVSLCESLGYRVVHDPHRNLPPITPPEPAAPEPAPGPEDGPPPTRH